MQERLPWLDRDAPNVDTAADLPKNGLDEVMFAHGHSTADDQHILRGQSFHYFPQRWLVISYMLGGGYGCTAAGQQALQQHRIALVNLARFQFASGQHQFISSRKESHRRSLSHSQLRHAM
jgi:hypothetical protein